ncbi:group II intron maturase-specific domain-containing protein [Streptomyces sp. NPDC007264]|uniref:group II intron maturase-specific domain-containing protein n=1 Tax=Streptomyces sp. NPDC007264 TaxID=3364777 RepID=UPI0036D7605C
MQHARDRIRELTERRRMLRPVKVIVEDVNAFLRGWGAYFRFGNSAHRFDQISSYARMRIGGFIAKKHRRSRKFGWSVVAHAASDSLGLVALHGTVVAPRPFRDWRGRPNAGGERRR